MSLFKYLTVYSVPNASMLVVGLDRRRNFVATLACCKDHVLTVLDCLAWPPTALIISNR